MNRGEREGKLKVSVWSWTGSWALRTVRRYAVVPGSAAMEFVKAAAEDA